MLNLSEYPSKVIVSIFKEKFLHKKGSSCCGYGADGAKTGGYDCLLIPGPEKAIVPSPATHLALGMCQAGGGMGLASLVAGTASITICSQYIFHNKYTTYLSIIFF